MKVTRRLRRWGNEKRQHITQNKILFAEQNTRQGGNIVKKICIVCGREFDSDTENGVVMDDICDLCEGARDELSNGKGED